MKIESFLPFIFSFVLWAAFHSLSASLKYKDLVRDWMGRRRYDAFYRLIYNALSMITFLPVLYLGAVILPDKILWTIPQPLAVVFVLIQLAGLLGLIYSLLQTDLFRFLGLGQVIRYLKGEPEINPSPQMVTRGAYAYVRHPLYTFSLLVIWFFPVMTLQMFLFNLLATAYFWVGSVYEEKKLNSLFGEAYLNYCKRVPRLFPIKVFSKK